MEGKKRKLPEEHSSDLREEPREGQRAEHGQS